VAAKKKTVVEEKQPLPNRIMRVMLDQVGDGNALIGFTFAEIREALGLLPPDEEFAEVVSVMSEMRDHCFLAHKFNHPALEENFYEGDPTDIPNIQKRENSSKVKQLVFFVHPRAIMIDDDTVMRGLGEPLPDVSGSGEEFKMQLVFTRENIRGWFDGLAELIDLHMEEELVQLSNKMILALQPS
jgi:hypothetical protein